MSTQLCPIKDTCNSLTKMDCSSRDFANCNYFKQALSEYCKKIHECCGRCKYAGACTFEAKRTRRY
jgi:hypothetical protein